MSKPSVVLMGLVVIGGVIFLSAIAPHDDSDPPGARSGLAVRTDALTGCQYLSAGHDGGITPRLSADGKQICGNPR